MFSYEYLTVFTKIIFNTKKTNEVKFYHIKFLIYIFPKVYFTFSVLLVLKNWIKSIAFVSLVIELLRHI